MFAICSGAPEIEITDEMIDAGERALIEIGCVDNDLGACALVSAGFSTLNG
jgi:hypothetical protein